MNRFFAISLLTLGVVLAAPPKYGGHGGGYGGDLVEPGPAVVYTYPAVAPVVKCGHNLVVNCGAHHAGVPCHAASHGHGHGAYGGHEVYGGHATYGGHEVYGGHGTYGGHEMYGGHGAYGGHEMYGGHGGYRQQTPDMGKARNTDMEDQGFVQLPGRGRHSRPGKYPAFPTTMSPAPTTPSTVQQSTPGGYTKPTSNAPEKV